RRAGGRDAAGGAVGGGPAALASGPGRVVVVDRVTGQRMPAGSAIAGACLMNPLFLITLCVTQVPAPPAGTSTPAVLEALVAWAGAATVRGVLGAYIASSKVVVLGCCRPTAKTVATLPAAKELEM